ncbi:MAG: Superoxide dismutase [Mn] 2 [Chroococcopsis gigantea SAG 12.99]|jgi:Fe-Mn family superoxide dismutase|nr:superoxide dismutase [Chlorogloea purpurea SAG 13.99]MDV2999424.1 Superoxide dismutase [Mn] 2 [Chroococcopsis gigantea SAG 12.99]
MQIDRRRFLYLLGAGVGTACVNNFMPPARADNKPSGPFTLPPLPYGYKELEPYIDEETMRFHHDKHHAAYVNNLNVAVSKYPELKTKTVEELLRSLDSLPTEIQKTVRNNGGGHLNHSLFWQIMKPDGGGKPKGELNKAITEQFGSFEVFQTKFNEAAGKVFGSGWAWLALSPDKKLEIITTPNQDSPLLTGYKPVMGNDVWEHAYYLKYRNQRAEYLKQWWNVLNWDEVNNRYLQFIA